MFDNISGFIWFGLVLIAWILGLQLVFQLAINVTRSEGFGKFCVGLYFALTVGYFMLSGDGYGEYCDGPLRWC